MFCLLGVNTISPLFFVFPDPSHFPDQANTLSTMFELYQIFQAPGNPTDIVNDEMSNFGTPQVL